MTFRIVRLKEYESVTRAIAVMGEVTPHGKVVTGERFAFDNDLELLFRGSVEAGHEKVQVGSESLHDGDLARHSPDDGRDAGTRLLVNIHPRRSQGIAQRFKVAVDALRGPSGEVLFQVLSSSFWLDAKRVATQIN